MELEKKITREEFDGLFKSHFAGFRDYYRQSCYDLLFAAIYETNLTSVEIEGFCKKIELLLSESTASGVSILKYRLEDMSKVILISLSIHVFYSTNFYHPTFFKEKFNLYENLIESIRAYLKVLPMVMTQAEQLKMRRPKRKPFSYEEAKRQVENRRKRKQINSRNSVRNIHGKVHPQNHFGFSKSDVDKDSFDALTDGQMGDYYDFDGSQDDIDNYMGR